MSLHETASDGDRLTTLRALRDRLAGEIDTCDSKRDVAALAQRLMDVLVQIETAEKAQPAKKGTALDEISDRRAKRAQGAGRAAGGGQRG